MSEVLLSRNPDLGFLLRKSPPERTHVCAVFATPHVVPGFIFRAHLLHNASFCWPKKLVETPLRFARLTGQVLNERTDRRKEAALRFALRVAVSALVRALCARLEHNRYRPIRATTSIRMGHAANNAHQA